MITLNNKEYKWKFKFSAQKTLEEISGKNAMQIAEVINSMKTNGIPFDFALQVAYCGLKSGNKEITIEQVEEILDNGTGKDVVSVMRKYNEDMQEYLEIASDPNEISQTSLEN